MKFHHIGIATNDIDESVIKYKAIHNVVYESGKIYDDLQNVYLSFLETDEDLNVEFVAGEKVKSLLEKGISYYHTCFTVKDIDHKIKQFVKSGAIVVSSPKPAILFNMRKVAFLYTQSGLIELLEENV